MRGRVAGTGAGAALRTVPASPAVGTVVRVGVAGVTPTGPLP